tara:strand:- start:1060 stop:1278 length:219 start_codon:yes stop_codon:yes gene_type:complete
MNSLEELGEKVEILAEAANRHYDRAEKFKQLLIDIIQKQSDMHDYGHPQFHEFQEYLSDVLVDICEIEGLDE